MNATPDPYTRTEIRHGMRITWHQPTTLADASRCTQAVRTPRAIPTRRLRLLAIGRATRAPHYPHFPTIVETLPGYENGGWIGFIAPAGTSREIVTLLNREMNRAVTLPDVREKLTAFGLEIHAETPEYFTDVIRRDFEKWGKLVREIGFKPR